MLTRKSTSLKDKKYFNMDLPMEVYTKEIILNKLIDSCLNFDAKIFKPYLQSEIVITDAPDKKRFYWFFKKMLITAKSNSVEPMSFKIEIPHWEDEEDMKHYNLYDSVHKHSRLCIRVKETENQVYLDTMPF